MSGFPNGLAGLTINGTLLIPSLNDPSYPEVGEDTSGTPWLSGWSYRRTVTVDNLTATALSNFQIIIRLNTAYLIQRGKMRSDCGDIRVTDSTGALLSIWIDPATKNTTSTKIYVKVPSIAASARVTLYLFYGNPTATDVSNGATTFDFFDDFLGTTLDTNKWASARFTGTGTWSVIVNNGYVEINAAAGTRAGIVAKTGFNLPFIVEGTFRYVSGDQVWNSVTQTSGGSHNDLVEHGYAGTGTTYYYRKASGGTYNNYQTFSRPAPRSTFAYFRQEWTTSSSRYFEYLPNEDQANTVTTQDRYTASNKATYVQLSTIGGVAQWDWVGVRKYAATPPAVYFRTLTSTVLKVNANISGTGSIIIGSSTYLISYPQTVTILVNGSIGVATVQIYGEPQNPFIDFPANPIFGYSTSFTLQNGLPLRRFQTIAIGRGDYKGDPWTTYPPADLYFVVESYDAATKTVTVSPPIVDARPTKSLVCLVSRPVAIRRFGTSPGVPLTGSGATVQGCVIDVQNATNNATTATSSTFTNFVAINGKKGASSVLPVTSTFTGVLVVYGQQGWNGVSGISINNAALLSVSGGLGDNISGSFANIWVQNAQYAFNPSTPSSPYAIDTLWAVGVGGVIGVGRADLIKNLTADYADYLVRDGPTLFNVTCGANVSVIFGGLSGSAGLALPNIQGLTLEGTNTSIGFLGLYHDVIIRGLKGNLPTPPSSIDNNSLPATSPVKALYFVEWQGFGSYSQARGRYFRHGRVVSDVSASPPAPNTFKFHLSETTNIQPIYLDWQFNGGGTIQVTGTITQLGSGESVKVQIFSVDKEPLLGSTPDYENTYTATGSININWTPPSAGTWIVRVLAYPQQTTGPITIANLQVAGGGTGGDGGGQTYNVNVSDSVTPTLSDSATSTHSFSLSDGITAPLSDQATLSAPISLSDSLSPTLSDSGSTSATISASDSIAPTLQDNANLTHNLAVSDSLVPTLSDSAQTSAQLSATDSVAPTLSETVNAENIYQVGVSDQITPTLSDSAQASAQVFATDNIEPTLSENVSAENIYQVGVSDTLTATLQDGAQAQAQVSATEAITATLSENVSSGSVYEVGISDQITPTLGDSGAIVGQVSATENITPTLSEGVTVGNVYEIGVSDQITSTLSDSSTITGQVNATENIAPTLQDSGETQVQISQTEALSPTIQEAPLASATLSVSDTIAPTLQDSGQVSAQVAATETVAPTLQENVTTSNVYNVGVSDEITATLDEDVSERFDITPTESITPTLQDGSAIQTQITQTEIVTPTLQEVPSTTLTLSASEAIAPTLQDTAQPSIQVSATENLNPMLQESVTADNIYNVGVSDGVTATLSETINEQASIAVTDSIVPTLAEDALAGNIYDISVADNVTPTLTESVTEQAMINAQEAIDTTLTEQTTTTPQVSVSEGISPTLQDSASASSTLTISEQVTPTLQDAISATAQVSATETLNPILQDSGGTQAQITQTDTIAPTLQEASSVSPTLSVSDTIVPALQDTLGAQVGVSASETIMPTLQEQTNVFAGDIVSVVEPLEISLREEDELAISLEEDELQLELDED
jgi:hypothetical protein